MGLTGFNRARRAAQDAAEAAGRERYSTEQTTDLEEAEKAQTETITDLPDMGTDAQPIETANVETQNVASVQAAKKSSRAK